MLNRFDLYIPLIYLATAIPYAWLGIYAWRRRPARAVVSFAWMMLSISFWTLNYSLEIFLPDLSSKLFLAQIEYVGIASTPVFLWFFAFEFTGRGHLISLRARLLYWIVPVLTLILVWTNPLHHLMWGSETISSEAGGLRLLNVQYGVFFWVHVIYSYVLLLSACVLLVMELIQQPGIYRVQISFVIVGILLPLIGSGIYVSGNSPIKNLDVTPLFFLPTALGLFWGITRYRMLEVLPLEHRTVLKNMKDGVIVLNSQQRILYINPIAGTLLGCTENEAIGKSLAQISGTYAEKLAPYLTGEEHQAEIKVGYGSQAQVFEVSVSPIATWDSRQIHSRSDVIVILRNITNRKEVEMLLSRRESIMSSISLAAEQFLKESAWEHNIPGVLEKIGLSADVTRVFVVMNYADENNVLHSSLCYEWASPSVSPQINNPDLKHIPLRKTGFSRWEDTLSQGYPIYGLVRELPDEERKLLEALGSVSIAVIPIFVDQQWWGFILFDETREERQWTPTELESFHAAANIFGAAEARSRTEQRVLRRQKSLNLLNDIVRDALRAHSLREMAQNAVDRLAELIHADGCFITLWDEINRKTSSLAAYGPYRDSYLTIQPSPGKKTLTESALMLGHTLIVEDAYNSPYVDIEVAKNFTSRSEMVLPLITGSAKLGALIFSFDKKRQFQAEEVSICEQAAGLIALAFEKFQAMEDAKRRADTSEILRKASLAVADKLEMDHTVSHILEQLNQVVPYDSASVQLLDGGELEIVGGMGWENVNDVLGIRFPIPGDNPNSVVIETGKPYHLPETWKVYKRFAEPPHNHIRSWLGVPLIAQEEIIGLLAIDSAEPHHFKEEDVRVASEFADQVAVALKNARTFQETQNLAITDALTGIYNRRGLFQLGEFELQRARRINRPFCAMMFDIDHFKRINDHHGHVIGDQVLHALAERCQKNSRTVDLIGRYGGEEFVILLPETNLVSAKVIAERLRQSIMDFPFATDAGGLRITVSIGVTEAAFKDTLNTLIERVDAALYKAKRSGRNCVVAQEADKLYHNQT